MSGNILIGTCDYDHDDWQGGFYDLDLPREWRFQHYANQFRSILLNVDPQLADDKELLDLLYTDSDDGFRFVLSVRLSSLQQHADKSWLGRFEKLAARVVAGRLQVDCETDHTILHSPAVLALESMGIPWALQGDGFGVDILYHHYHSFSKVWLPSEADAPTADGEFLIVLVEGPDLKVMRSVVENCQAWTGDSRMAGIYLLPGRNAAQHAMQGRLLLEMMGF